MTRAPPALLLAAALLTGCAAMRRGADNSVVVATTPIHAVTTPAGQFAAGWREDPLSAAATAPVFVPLWILEDAFFTGVSAVDLALTPVYIPWDVHRPLLYDRRRFPPSLRGEVAAEAAEAAAATVVILAPFAAIAVVCTNGGTWSPGGGTIYSSPPPTR